LKRDRFANFIYYAVIYVVALIYVQKDPKFYGIGSIGFCTMYTLHGYKRVILIILNHYTFYLKYSSSREATFGS